MYIKTNVEQSNATGLQIVRRKKENGEEWKKMK